MGRRSAGERAGKRRQARIAVGPVEILPPEKVGRTVDRVASLAVRSLARSQVLPVELLQAMDVPLGAAITAAVGIAAGALADSTRCNYARGWAHFAAWCRTQDVDPDAMPVHPVLIAAYVGHLVPRGRSSAATSSRVQSG